MIKKILLVSFFIISIFSIPTSVIAGASPYAAGIEAPLDGNQGCRLINNVNLTCPAGVYYALTFNQEYYDGLGMHSTTINTSRIYATVAGIYSIKAHFGILVSNTPTTEIQTNIRKNGTTFMAFNEWTSRYPTFPIIATDIWMEKGDYIELVCYQDSGLNATILAGQDSTPIFEAWRIGEGGNMIGQHLLTMIPLIAFLLMSLLFYGKGLVHLLTLGYTLGLAYYAVLQGDYEIFFFPVLAIVAIIALILFGWSMSKGDWL